MKNYNLTLLMNAKFPPYSGGWEEWPAGTRIRIQATNPTKEMGTAIDLKRAGEGNEGTDR